ncbi:hypothetical protein [Isoptericola sediminis]|uniref:Uncharacterized protein n=1 Tax=Isoptericola sediminis TaxID=2733572 RepID=A0A849K4U9_9MICO|nr:hypothetical protein [Isoptericola sediminis]NNU27430.1 hypothetical protein [Isoptericola sediminis]
MHDSEPALFTTEQAMRNVKPRVQAAVAQGSFLAVHEAQAAGASEEMKAAIPASYARAWSEIDAFLDQRAGDIDA